MDCVIDHDPVDYPQDVNNIDEDTNWLNRFILTRYGIRMRDQQYQLRVLIVPSGQRHHDRQSVFSQTIQSTLGITQADAHEICTSVSTRNVRHFVEPTTHFNIDIHTTSAGSVQPNVRNNRRNSRPPLKSSNLLTGEVVPSCSRAGQPAMRGVGVGQPIQFSNRAYSASVTEGQVAAAITWRDPRGK